MMSPRPLCYRLYLRSCLTSTSNIPSQPTPTSTCLQHQRCFHSSPHHQKPRRKKFPSVTKHQLDRIQAQRRAEAENANVSIEGFSSYTEEELQLLSRRYSPEQIEAIKAGEEAVSAHDLATQGKFRRDPLQFQYLDDFSRIEQTIDKKIEKLRGDEQEYRDQPMPYPLSDYFLEEGRMLNEIEREVELENFGEWVPARAKDLEEKGVGDRGIFNKLVLKRSQAQIGKAALKRYLGVATFKEAKEYCEKIDRDKWQENKAKRAASSQPADADADTKADLNQLMHDDPVAHIINDPRQPLLSAHFQNVILQDPKYKECYQWAKANPPPKQIFGMHKEEILADEAMVYPDVAPSIPPLDPRPLDTTNAEKANEAADAERNAGLEDLSEEDARILPRLGKQLNMSIADLKSLRFRTLTQHRVTQQTYLGKVQSYYCLAAVGNGNGMLGLGQGNAADVTKASSIARMAAVKNMVPILRYENRTIFGEVYGKVGAAEVVLSARKPGFGVRAIRHVYDMASVAGIHDLAGKCLRGRNAMNVSKAVFEALKSQKHPDDIARARGKKLVDVRKVYYSGRV